MNTDRYRKVWRVPGSRCASSSLLLVVMVWQVWCGGRCGSSGGVSRGAVCYTARLRRAAARPNGLRCMATSPFSTREKVWGCPAAGSPSGACGERVRSVHPCHAAHRPVPCQNVATISCGMAGFCCRPASKVRTAGARRLFSPACVCGGVGERCAVRRGGARKSSAKK